MLHARSLLLIKAVASAGLMKQFDVLILAIRAPHSLGQQLSVEKTPEIVAQLKEGSQMLQFVECTEQKITSEALK